MNAKASSTVMPRHLPVAAVLGLADSTGEDWARLRGLQYAQLSRVTSTRVAAQCVAALATVSQFMHAIPHMVLLGWLVGLVAALALAVRCDTVFHDAERRRITRQEFNRQAGATALLALLWVVPVAVFAREVAWAERLQLWTVLAMLMTASAVMNPAAPLGTILFLGIVGSAMITNFLLAGAFGMAGVALMFIVAIGLGTIESSRNFLLSRLAEAGMAERNEVVSLLLREYEEGDADWLWETDLHRRVRAVSPRFAYALGLDPEALDGKSFTQLIAGPAWESGHFHPSMHDLVERMKRRESFSNLLVRVNCRGADRWWELSGKPKLDDNGGFDGFRGVGSDVTEQRDSSDKIAYMARYDTLTGLPNRMMLYEALGEAMHYADQWRTRCAFLMIDLDRFKAVNDTLGHLVGDELLACVSERLQGVITENELCGRLGGDEFAVVIRDASDIQRVNRVAQAIIDRLSAPYTVDHHVLYVGASVGSAIGPRDGSTVEELMRNADLALYRSKDEGGGRHFTYEPGLHVQAEERRKLESSLRHALERDEFRLNYQPVVDTITERLVSFEALLRWTSKDHGPVSPAKFVPLAEDTRLIVPIGNWVLNEACREAANWPSRVKVAVNVSGEQLLDPDFIDSVVTALAMSGLPPQRLEIEVTESIFVRDAAIARSALERIMALGCGVALDDFGTGYSSLGYIRNMKFSTIKVDRSFVQGAAQGSPESLAIIRAVVAMADALDMSTTAEGVETEAELEVIRKLGCKKIQGYYYGRPMPAEDAMALFQRVPGQAQQTHRKAS